MADRRQHPRRPVGHLALHDCWDRRERDWTARGPELVTCWSCRYERDRPKREARRRAAKRAAEIRTPSRPPYESTAAACAMCGEPPVRPRRTWCSQACVDLWSLATQQATALAQLVELHGAVCWECGTATTRLEVDHRRPLWSLTDGERAELRWWLPFNLQLLCQRCHKAKSKREAAERAALRRAG